jgi:hypothetical protein
MYKSAGPFAHLTKAANQVENVLEARGLGLQLFLRDYWRRMGQQGPPPTCFPLGPAADTLSPGGSGPALQPRLSLLSWEGVIILNTWLQRD